MAILVAFVSSAEARTFTVTRADDPTPSGCDPGDCSLREAVGAANQHSGNDIVDFAGSLSGQTVLLTQGEIAMHGTVTIDGPGAGKLSISGDDLSRVFHVTGGKSTIDGVTIRDGKVTATATGARCPDTSAPTYALGGGILQDAGQLTLRSVKMRHNTVEGGATGIIGGGGIANVDGTLSVVRSQLAGNEALGASITTGGGIVNCVGQVAIHRSVVRGSFVSSHAIAEGGGIANGQGAAHDTGHLTLTKSTIADNSATSEVVTQGGGAFTSGGPVDVVGSTISGNDATVVSGGSVSDGGGFENANARVTFTNSTIANNLASAPNPSGGGVAVGGTGEKLVLRSVTLASNIADGTHSRGGNLSGAQSTDMLNSIVAAGKALTGSNCDGDVKASRHNLESRDTCGFTSSGELVNKNPKLADLGPNGGPTDTMALKRGSPAIGHAGVKSSPKRDQRGFKRDPKPDIGAYEFGAKP